MKNGEIVRKNKRKINETISLFGLANCRAMRGMSRFEIGRQRNLRNSVDIDFDSIHDLVNFFTPVVEQLKIYICEIEF